jgi:RND family efflux transporter MFP subunit
MPAPVAKSRVLRNVVIVVVVILIAAGAAFYRLRPTVNVVAVIRGPAVDTVSGSVVVHADKDLQEIKSESGGRVIWTDSRQLGMPYKAGEPIARLDSTDLDLEMKQTEDAYHALVERKKIEHQNDPAERLARQTLDAAKRRHDRNEISDVDFEVAQEAFDKVERELALADFDAKQANVAFEKTHAAQQRLLEKMTIRAPIDCILHEGFVAPGALIAPGTTIATYFANQRVVIAKVGEEDIGRVKIGQSAKVHLLNLPGRDFDATVNTILPFAEADTQRYSVYLDVKADLADLKPFSTGEAVILVGRHENQPLIPRRALFNEQFVCVVKDGVVEKRKVSVGFKSLTLIEVTANLAPGELVIVDTPDQFRDGQHVRVLEPK